MGRTREKKIFLNEKACKWFQICNLFFLNYSSVYSYVSDIPVLYGWLHCWLCVEYLSYRGWFIDCFGRFELPPGLMSVAISLELIVRDDILAVLSMILFVRTSLFFQFYLFIYLLYVCVCILFLMWLCVYMYVFTNLSSRAGCDIGSIFKQSLTDLDLEFSFSMTDRLTKAEEPSLPSCLPIAGRRIWGFIPFSRVFVV